MDLVQAIDRLINHTKALVDFFLVEGGSSSEDRDGRSCMGLKTLLFLAVEQLEGPPVDLNVPREVLKAIVFVTIEVGLAVAEVAEELHDGVAYDFIELGHVGGEGCDLCFVESGH